MILTNRQRLILRILKESPDSTATVSELWEHREIRAEMTITKIDTLLIGLVTNGFVERISYRRFKWVKDETRDPS